MQKKTIKQIEIDLFLDAIVKHHGYDFKNYTRTSLIRRIDDFLSQTNYHHISELIPQILHDQNFFEDFLHKFTVTVTEMFRDPHVYKAIRKEIIPFLKTYPFVKIWHAGCATGEEIYSMAILLHEEGMAGKYQIYATDIDKQSIEKAKTAIYPIEKIQQFTKNYVKSGGKKAFSDYYHSEYDSVILNRELKKNIIFASHNLVADAVFGEMNLIMCRNVLIYFNQLLQNKVLELFRESLTYKGFLCIGTKESLGGSSIDSNFDLMSDKEKIYRKNGST